MKDLMKTYGLLMLFLVGMACAAGDRPAFVSGTGWGNTGWFIQIAPQSAPGPTASLDWNGLVCTEIQRAGTDTWIDNGCNHNLITNTGKNMSVCDLFGIATYGTTNQWTQIALGQNVTAMAATDTALSGIYSTCNLGIAGGTAALVATGNVSVSNIWTSSCDAQTITAAALYNATNSKLAAEAVVTSATLNNGDKLTLTYYGAQT
ncbi:MAG: hypothetical protein NT130_05870 [Candidatus Micrarchaeota archaeon]|nr:hypothetical protein [Candidatus Micrarchaeota archaeon]